MAKITPSDRNERATVVIKSNKSNAPQGAFNWWKAKSSRELAAQLISTATFLKEQQGYRYRQAGTHARLYGNVPLMNFAGSMGTKLSTQQNLPIDRPTMNVVQSCIDTLVSRMVMNKPRPIFLTENGDYKQRKISKQLNQFIAGELYQTDAYKLAEQALRDSAILGDGVLHVFETDDGRVGLERVLSTEILVDHNDGFYGKPRSIYRLKLVDRSVVANWFPEEKSKIAQAEQAYPDNSSDSQKTASDQIMLVEGWHLPSKKGATDGRHTIACTAGVICDEEYNKEKFPFVTLPYAPRMIGYWAQGLAEQLTGTQIEINKLLVTISQSMSLVGVPRVFVEDGSKVVKAHLNNQIGAIVTYRGTKPEYSVAPSVHPELYAQLQRLIDYSYQQSGISALAASSQKPAGLNSGEALRVYDDNQSDRFTVLNKRWEAMFIDLAYLIIDKARDIAERDGKYQTVYPNKDGTKEIDLPAAKMLDDVFVIQCFDTSSLPRDPAGRAQKVVEYMQSGVLTPDEGRRLLNFGDLEQVDKLKFAAVERIYQQLDNIIDDGNFVGPDAFTDIAKAVEISVQYYNLYASAKLEESKLEMLRQYNAQAVEMQQALMAPPPGAMPANPQAVPAARPVSDMLPQVPQG